MTTSHQANTSHNRSALLRTIGARVIAERFDKSLLVGEIVTFNGTFCTLAPIGSLRRVRILCSRIRRVWLMASMKHDVYSRICERQRAGSRFTAKDVGVGRPPGPKEALDE